MDAAAIREPPADEVHVALRRILVSRTFADKERLRTLLRYIVEEKLNNHSARLKEYSLARAVFGRGEDFDFKNDSIVRVQVRNLRKSLDVYYDGEGRDDPTCIAVPKGSYVPVFSDRTLSSEEPRRRPRAMDVLLPLLGLTLAAASAAFLFLAPNRPDVSTIAVIPFLAASNDQGESMAAAGLTEELIAELARDRVYRTLSAAPLRDAERNGALIEAGRRQNAGFILTGVVRRSGGDWHIHARLLRLDDGLNLWSQSYRVRSEGLAALAPSIGESVVRTLKAQTPAQRP